MIFFYMSFILIFLILRKGSFCSLGLRYFLFFFTLVLTYLKLRQTVSTTFIQFPVCRLTSFIRLYLHLFSIEWIVCVSQKFRYSFFVSIFYICTLSFFSFIFKSLNDHLYVLYF